MRKKILIVGIVVLIVLNIILLLTLLRTTPMSMAVVSTDRGRQIAPRETFSIGWTTAEQADEAGQITPTIRTVISDEIRQITPAIRMVIRTGTIHIVVEDIHSSIKSIVQYAENKGGWVVGSTISGIVTEQEKTLSGSVVVRVPSKIFDEAMAYFKGLAEKVSYERTQGQDVTEEYTDIQSRLRNLEATETQLLKIMERAGTITEVLAVQRELTTVRG